MAHDPADDIYLSDHDVANPQVVQIARYAYSVSSVWSHDHGTARKRLIGFGNKINGLFPSGTRENPASDG